MTHNVDSDSWVSDDKKVFIVQDVSGTNAELGAGKKGKGTWQARVLVWRLSPL